MSESKRQPRPGDKVRITPNPFDGELHCDGSQGRLIQVRDMSGRLHAFGPDYADIEVVEPVDDPGKDPIGTVRAWHDYPYIRSDRDADYPWVGLDRDTGNTHSSMAGCPVIGAVPGTPAAEAQQRKSASHEDHCKDLAEAIYASHIYPWEDLLFTARRYATHAIRDERSERNLLEQEGGLDNEGVVLGQYYAEKARKREARVFRSDGPEPPPDVKILTDDAGSMPFLVRHADGWVWRGDATLDPNDANIAQHWGTAAAQTQRGATLREVLS